jgi:hypothetical protein
MSAAPSTGSAAVAADDVFIAMPIYTLGKARTPDGHPPSLEEMRDTLGRWLAGEPTDAPAPRGIVTARCVMKRLGELGRRGVLDVVPCCTLLALARSVQATRFLESGCAWMLCLDDDISADPETILEMLEADADCIFATYAQRLAPHRITLHTVDGVNPRRAPQRRTLRGGRVLEVASGGLGCALVRRNVVETLCRLHPELAFEEGGTRHTKVFDEAILALDGERRSVGEDVAFYHRVRGAGFRVECFADATVNHDGTIANLGTILDSPVPFDAGDDARALGQADGS